MGNMFWVHYQRKADGQDFHERLTAKGLLELLTCGGITLCGIAAEERRREGFEDRAQI